MADKLKASRRRAALRGRALDYKGKCCQICGYDRCAAALEFHHIDPMEKDFTLSAKMTSWGRIQAELDKCILLCSRCHREVHDGLHAGFLDLGNNDYGDDEDELEIQDGMW